MIKEITLRNFKMYKNKTIKLTPTGITVLVGGNNSGKSTIIQALAIWEFCKFIVSQEKGVSSLLAGGIKQGIGISVDEFLPIAIPSLNHLWTNLKTQKTSEDADGYTLKIGCKWDTETRNDCYLEIGLSLANDRLFVKPTNSNLTAEDKVPNISFMPTFAGILEKEPRVTPAERRKQMGKGLAGAIMRNMIYELYESNINERKRLKADKTKISNKDLQSLRENDPYELLQEMLRRVFSMELKVEPFNEAYNTILKVLCFGVTVNENTKRYSKQKNYTNRDIMVQGNGFLQWLTIFPLALNSHYDIMLLDEPDAHLHNVLQREMISSLENLIPKTKKQIIFATHSTRIIKETEFSNIFNANKTKYLNNDEQKSEVVLGLGGEYLPYVDRAKITKRILFLEGTSDKSFIERWTSKLDYTLPDVCYIFGNESHKERCKIFNFLKKQIPDLKAISIRDRDIDNHENDVNIKLNSDRDTTNLDFCRITWKRRNHENYLLFVPAIVRGLSNADIIKTYLLETHTIPEIAIESFIKHDISNALMTVDGKSILVDLDKKFNLNKFDIASNFTVDEIPVDIKFVVNKIKDFI